MTKEEMDNIADEYLSSNFDGGIEDENAVDTVEYYDGEDDDYLDFTGGAKNFKSEGESDKRFRFTIENTTTSDKIVVLTPGSFPTLRILVPDPTSREFDAIGGEKLIAPTTTPVIMWDNPGELQVAGFPINCVLDDGVIYKDATGQVSVVAPDTARIRFLREYLKSNPSRITKMSFISTIKDFFDTPIILQEVSPYRKNGEERIELQDYFKPGQFQDNKIEVTKGFQLDDVTVAYMTIPAGCKIGATFNIGAVERQGLALKRKAEKAKSRKGVVRTIRVKPSVRKRFGRR